MKKMKVYKLSVRFKGSDYHTVFDIRFYEHKNMDALNKFTCFKYFIQADGSSLYLDWSSVAYAQLESEYENNDIDDTPESQEDMLKYRHSTNIET